VYPDGLAILTIAISTIDEDRLSDFDLRYPMGGGWTYLVLVQSPSQGVKTPARTEDRGARSTRDDVRYLSLEGTGVTKSRNAAIDQALTPLLLFCDDDVNMLPDGLELVIQAFKDDSSLAVLTGRTLVPGGAVAKNYGRHSERLSFLNSAKFGTVELAVRLEPIRENALRFDENFGAGAEYPIGDEFIFITDCLKCRLKAWYFPIDIAVHAHDSSGHNWESRAHLKSRALAFRRIFGPVLSFPLSLAFVVRNRRKFSDMRSMLCFLQNSIFPA
jgi:Glycosyl transferase family 2.